MEPGRPPQRIFLAHLVPQALDVKTGTKSLWTGPGATSRPWELAAKGTGRRLWLPDAPRRRSVTCTSDRHYPVLPAFLMWTSLSLLTNTPHLRLLIRAPFGPRLISGSGIAVLTDLE